jgi:hypothetical protein
MVMQPYQTTWAVTCRTLFRSKEDAEALKDKIEKALEFYNKYEPSIKIFDIEELEPDFVIKEWKHSSDGQHKFYLESKLLTAQEVQQLKDKIEKALETHDELEFEIESLKRRITLELQNQHTDECRQKMEYYNLLQKRCKGFDIGGYITELEFKLQQAEQKLQKIESNIQNLIDKKKQFFTHVSFDHTPLNDSEITDQIDELESILKDTDLTKNTTSENSSL